MAAELKQEFIWRHFQGDGAAIFAPAIPRLRFLSRYARKTTPHSPVRILNIGVGNGWLERECKTFGWDVYSLDPDSAAAKSVSSQDIRPTTGTAELLPFKDSCFDIVFCSEVLEHLDDKQIGPATQEIARVLKAGGLMVGTVPFREDLNENMVVCPCCGEYFHRWGHHQSFDKPAMRQLLETAGLRVTRLTTTAFRDYAAANTFLVVKFLLRWPLAKAGLSIVYSNIFFAAIKPTNVTCH